MLKKILVPLDASDHTSAATRMAVHIAKSERNDPGGGVGVSGLGVVDLDQIPTGRFASVVPREEIIAEAEQKADELIASFKQAAQGLGLPEDRIEAQRASGSPFRLIIRESVFCDLIVMGEKCSFPPVNQDYETMHHLYHEASRPVILADPSFETVEAVVMAMDGTAPASRMMYNYVHANPFPGARVILVYSKEEVAQYGLEGYFKRVEDFLAAYGLNIRTRSIEGELEEGVAPVIKEEGAQVLALGAHRDHFLSWLSDPLKIRQNFATRLLRATATSLFVVH